MGDVSKILDTVIKAPLWFFFAALVITTLPLLNIPYLVHAGLRSSLQIFGQPLVLYALISTALFMSSAVARIFPLIIDTVRFAAGWVKWQVSFAGLTPKSRAFLAVMEHKADRWTWYDPMAPEIKLLRDRDLITAELIASDGTAWGKFELSYPYQMAYGRRRRLFRSALSKVKPDDVHDVSMTMQAGERAASRLG